MPLRFSLFGSKRSSPTNFCPMMDSSGLRAAAADASELDTWALVHAPTGGCADASEWLADGSRALALHRQYGRRARELLERVVLGWRTHKDLAGSAQQDDGLVLLCFRRTTKEVFDVLLRSPLAYRLIAEGVEVQPGWTKGRLVLAAGATEAALQYTLSNRWHVAVRRADEEQVLATVATMDRKLRPRLKPNGGRVVLTSETSPAVSRSTPRALVVAANKAVDQLMFCLLMLEERSE